MNFIRGRPENILPAQFYYNENVAKKYTNSTRIKKIQTDMTERVVELLNYPEDNTSRLILDVGCGSGLSGEVLSQHGFHWIGVDISTAMLEILKKKKRMNIGDAILNDVGQGLPFKIGSFDGAVGVSVIQWLCTNYNKSENAFQRLKCFFSSVYSCIKKGGKAVFQFYPENPEQTNMITRAATKSGFTGGVVIDYPNSTKAKKYYLVLFSGKPVGPKPSPLMGEHEMEPTQIRNYESNSRKNMKRRFKKGERRKSLKEFVIGKKVRDRFRGRKTAADSKYSGRKRKDRW